jgi:hypothetical protein
MIKRILSFFVLAAFLTAMLPAADTSATTTPPSPPAVAQIVSGMVDQLTKLLDLTTALQTAVKTNSLNGITTAAGAIGGLTTQQVTAQATGDAAFWIILTTEQQTKLGVLRAAGLGGPGGGGQGAPGGPPPSSGSATGRG